MKRIAYFLIVLSLLLPFAFLVQKRITVTEASPDVFQGDLILTNDNVTMLTGYWEMNGSIIVKDNATLVLNDAAINFTQTVSKEFNLTLEEPNNGNPRLQASNASLSSNHSLDVHLHGNSTVNANSLTVNGDIYFYDAASGEITNSNQLNTINCYDASNITVADCDIGSVSTHDASSVTLKDSGVSYLTDEGEKTSLLTVSNCTVTNAFNSLGGSQAHLDKCNVSLSEIDSSSAITFSDCWLNGTQLRSSPTVTLTGQCSINGSLTVEENATLILKDANLSVTQAEDWECEIAFRNPLNGNPRFQTENSAVTSNYNYVLTLHQNTSATLSDSTFKAVPGKYCMLLLRDSAKASLDNLTVYGLSSMDSSNLIIFNSNIEDFDVHDSGNASVDKCELYISSSSENGTITLHNATITTVQAHDSSSQRFSESAIGWIYTRNTAAVWLTNSRYNNTLVRDQSRILAYWYLNVHVIDSIQQDVPSANVSIMYPNATLADSKMTNSTGWASFILITTVKNATGVYDTSNYSVAVVYGAYSNSSTVNMTGNQEVTLALGQLVIPEYPLFTIISLMGTTTLLAVLICRHKKHVVSPLSHGK
jgi:hypothetical protein